MNSFTRFVTLPAIVLLATVARAGGLDEFTWLEGAWERPSGELKAIEEWTRVSPSTFEGVVYLTDGSEVRVTEHLRIERFGDRTYYLALPLENEFPTPFELVERGDDRWVFENPGYEFPQRLIYTRTEDGNLAVRIEGTGEEGDRGFDLRFTRRLLGDE